MVRQNVWLKVNRGRTYADDLFRQDLSGIVLSTEWIESFHGMSVDGDRQFLCASDFACEESVEDETQMPFQNIQLFADDLVASAAGLIFGQPVEVLPDDCCSMTADALEIRQGSDVLGIENR